MRKLVGWMAGLAGIAALAKLFHARPRTVPPLAPPEPAPDDPAEELRRKLAEARAVSPDPAGETEPEAAPDVTERSLEERRAEIHSRAQDAIDAMRNDAT